MTRSSELLRSKESKLDPSELIAKNSTEASESKSGNFPMMVPTEAVLCKIKLLNFCENSLPGFSKMRTFRKSVLVRSSSSFVLKVVKLTEIQTYANYLVSMDILSKAITGTTVIGLLISFVIERIPDHSNFMFSFSSFNLYPREALYP